MCLVLAGCSGKTSDPGAVVFVDGFIEEWGVVSARAGKWADAFHDGWRLEGELAHARVRSAGLRLEATERAARALSIEAAAPRGMERVVVQVALNEERLGEMTLGAEQTTHSFTTRAEQWYEGTNLLEFSLDNGVGGSSAELWELSRVEYPRLHDSTTPRQVARDGTAYVLPPGCGLVFQLEVPLAGELDVQLAAGSRGELELALAELDPVGTAGTPTRWVRPVPADTTEASFALPAARAPLRGTLRWRSDEAPLRIEHLSRSRPGQRRPPSVLFVSIDTLSALHMSLYGYPRDTTPELVRRASEFAVFEQARANAPWTIPSYMSQFTGLLPKAHMLTWETAPGRMPETWELHQIAPNRYTMAEFFRANGHRTAAFVDNPWLARGFGFEQGFELLDPAAAERPLEDPEGGLRFTVPRALEWLDGLAEDEPFFLFVQAFDPHAPYTTTAPWKGAFSEGAERQPGEVVPVGQGVSFAYGCIPEHVAVTFSPGASAEALPTAPIVAAYDEKIREVDAALATLFTGLEQRGLWDELLIVISADHGESTTGHEFYFNHALLYQDTLHVPLLVRLPGGEGAGRRHSEVVELVDLYPTLVEAVLGERRASGHGESLMPLLRGTDAPRNSAYAEWGMMEQASFEQDGWKLIASRPRYARYQTQVTSPRLDRAALVRIAPELAHGFPNDEEVARVIASRPELDLLLESLAGPFFELYHLAEDPGETRDLAAREPARVEALLARLLERRRLGELAQLEATFVTGSQEPTSAELEEIERLGYGGK